VLLSPLPTKILGLFQDLITSTALVTAIPESQEFPFASIASGRVNLMGEDDSLGELGVAAVAGGIMSLDFELVRDFRLFCCSC